MSHENDWWAVLGSSYHYSIMLSDFLRIIISHFLRFVSLQIYYHYHYQFLSLSFTWLWLSLSQEWDRWWFSVSCVSHLVSCEYDSKNQYSMSSIISIVHHQGNLNDSLHDGPFWRHPLAISSSISDSWMPIVAPCFLGFSQAGMGYQEDSSGFVSRYPKIQQLRKSLSPWRRKNVGDVTFSDASKY